MQGINIKLFFTFFIITFFNFLFANENITNYSYFIDNENSKNINEMILFKNWDKLETTNLGYSNKTFWFKFSLNEKQNSYLKYFLVAQNHKLEEIDLFIVKDNNIISQFKSGQKRSIKNQEVNSRKYIFPLPNELNNLEIYMKIKNNFSPINLDFTIYNNYSLDAFINMDNFMINIIYTLFIILLIVHILIYNLTKIDFYKYYLIYLFLIIIVGLFNTGILNLYIFKNGIDNFTLVLFKMIGFIMIIYLIKIIQFILNLEKEKIINKIIHTLIILLFLSIVFSDIFSLFGYMFPFFIYLSHIIFVILFLFILSILFLKSFKKNFLSNILILIWLPLFSIIILNTLHDFYNSFIDFVSMEYLIKFLFIYESIFISVIIAYKYNLIEKEQERLVIESKNKEIIFLRQSKLIKMGEMLNNIAHQWKQPLARINSIIFKSYHLIDENKKEDLKKELLSIENETFYMSNTISTLLNFFHIDKKKEIFNLVELANKQKKFVSQFNHIKLIINCEDEKISTNGYKNEYEQVIQVIIENAIESLIEFKIENPMIIISITIEDNLPLFTVENNGNFLDEKIMDKIFEPYFTTKNKDKHQGIGLYMSKMLIEESMSKELIVLNTSFGVKFIIKG